MRIAVLVKQIPSPEQFMFDDGHIVRDGVDLEVNAYCRRANAKAVELACPGGEVVVFTMGPPDADDALREMIACGATRGVHLCDPAFAGSDTLATARALAAAIRHVGPFDLVLAGLNSLDADTGQVPAELAELLGVPFAQAIRDIDIADDHSFTARLETDTGYRMVTGELPAVMSTAERLCAPSKAPSDQRRLVDAALITRVTAGDIGLDADECGAAGSPTSVGTVRLVETKRNPRLAASVSEAIDMLTELGAFDDDDVVSETVPHPGAAAAGTSGREVWCSFRDPQVGAELLGEAAALATVVSGSVTAVVATPVPAGLGSLGADSVLAMRGVPEAADWADVLATAAGEAEPWVLLVEGTRDGRFVASVVAARHGWGLTGDAVGLEIDESARLVAWKPAFGGRLEVPIHTSSSVQMATVRPGVLKRRSSRMSPDPDPSFLEAPSTHGPRTVSVSSSKGEEADLQRASVVVAVGIGVEPEDYGLIDELRAALGDAELGATRKVTDRGWLPRSRQIGVTGHSIAPRLLVAVGSSGRFNHMVGIRNSRVTLAINSDPDAEIFGQVDVGLVGDWHQVVSALSERLNAQMGSHGE